MLWLLVGWLVCSVLGYTGTLAYIEGTYPPCSRAERRDDLLFAVVVNTCGPFSLLMVWVQTGWFHHGFQWRLRDDV
jgi:hypothetical protein